MMRSWPAVWALSLLMSSVGHGRAGFITPHSEGFIYGSGSGGIIDATTYYRTDMSGEPVSLYGSGSGSTNGTQTASSMIFTDLSPNFMGGKALSTNNRLAEYVPTGTAVAAANWRDILYLHGPGNMPSAVKLTFHVTGSVSAPKPMGPSPYGVTNVAEFGAYVDSSVTNFHDVFNRTWSWTNTPDSSISLRSKDDAAESWGFESLSVSHGSFDNPFSFTFDGTFSYIAKYDSAYGGYTFQVTEFAFTGARQGMVSAQWDDPLTVDFVTNPDGSTLIGYKVSFDSGLQLSAQAVPEPSSLALLGLGVAALLGAAYRRRKRAVFPC